MKKLITTLFICLSVFIITGCSDKTEKTITCTYHSNDVVNGYELDSTYVINYVGKIVKNVETTQVVKSDNNETLDYFEENLNNTYQTVNDTYGGYTFTVDNSDNKVTAKTTIDYTKMDLKKYVEDQPALKNYLNSNNDFTISGVKSIYTGMGATCE